MNESALHKAAADCAEELPGAQLEHPFGPDLLKGTEDPQEVRRKRR